MGEVCEREIALSLRWKGEALVAVDAAEIELSVGAVDTEEDVEETIEAALMDDDIGPEGETVSWIHLKSSMGKTFVLCRKQWWSVLVRERIPAPVVTSI